VQAAPAACRPVLRGMRVRPRGLCVGGAVCLSGRRAIAGAAPGDVHSLFTRMRTPSIVPSAAGGHDDLERKRRRRCARWPT
jgi:hypothetical protein